MFPRYRLLVSCPDALGIVARVSQSIAQHKGWILEANHHSDHANGRFFMRYELSSDQAPFDPKAFKQDFEAVARDFKMDWDLVDTTKPKKVILMASKQAHCLADLLHRYHEGELECEIPCVVSNHPDLEKMVKWYDIPYHHVPMNGSNKAEAFRDIEALWQEYDAEAVVLARFMQILPGDVCDRWAGKIINIHHSFLPSFIGANPYQQAHTRGVKLIGATCHYVTRDLDEGPIIEQDVARVSHKETTQDLVCLGRDVEKTVLARGLRYHLEDRVLLDRHKTVVFK